jgi:hypothetical protein
VINDPLQGGARTEDGVPNTAYPGLLRIFAGATVAAALCGLAALAAEDSKSLHPAPFLALATLLAVGAAIAFLSMLTCLVGKAAMLWWKR